MSTPASATRSLSPAFLAAAVALAAGLGFVAPQAAEAGDACTTKDFQFPAVKKACESGGRKAAKDLMKQAVKKAKAAGKDMKCKSCHEDMKSYKLKDNAAKDLKPWI